MRRYANVAAGAERKKGTIKKGENQNIPPGEPNITLSSEGSHFVFFFCFRFLLFIRSFVKVGRETTSSGEREREKREERGNGERKNVRVRQKNVVFVSENGEKLVR